MMEPRKAFEIAGVGRVERLLVVADTLVDALGHWREHRLAELNEGREQDGNPPIEKLPAHWEPEEARPSSSRVLVPDPAPAPLVFPIPGLFALRRLIAGATLAVGLTREALAHEVHEEVRAEFLEHATPGSNWRHVSCDGDGKREWVCLDLVAPSAEFLAGAPRPIPPAATVEGSPDGELPF